MEESKLDETIRGIEYCMSSNAPDDCEHCPGQYICGDSIMQENFVDLPKSMVNNALDLLKNQKHGSWQLKIHGKPESGGTTGEAVCDQCGESTFATAVRGELNYCPNCGAKMKKISIVK